ncbi:MAG: efflux RND transporter permease subunit [bacterium]|nr:efflux RND transporter permease subunit [bacterium]
MIKFGKAIVKSRWIIFIVSILLLIPSVIGMVSTRVNYDILSYLPKDIETMVGQDILVDQFGTGGFSMFVVEGMEDKDVAKLKTKIEGVDHVDKVVWYNTIADLSIPKSILPDKIYKEFNTDDSTLMAIIFDTTTSADETMDAIAKIREIAGKQCFVSGMSAIVTDTKDLTNKEEPIYIFIAVLLSTIVLSLTMDSFLAPIFFLLSIGMAILYNLGSNYFLGEVSYITKALSAVLQLGVTMDYSIFLWHSYEEEKQKYQGDKERAMSHAISNTLVSVVGSSITTVAGFIALCFMSFTLGMDLGVVMAKGVIFGVISCVTILPSFILIFDKALVKTSHKALLPELGGISKFVIKRYYIFLILFAVLLVPAIYGEKNTDVYYNLDETLPKDLPSIIANDKLKADYNMNATHMVLVSSKLESNKVGELIDELDNVKGVKWALGLESIIGPAVPENMIPKSIRDVLKNDKWEMLLVNSEYKTATDEMTVQCDEIGDIIKKYDSDAMLVGEAPCTVDLIKITDNDFKVVSAVSIGVIFLIILVIFKSISLPVILVAVIEFAIFINMGIPYYTHTEIPFIASVVIGTIQLGATVDYAILMTTRYKKERNSGKNKHDAILIAHSASIKSIVISALSFFAATFGVGLYSNVDMISSLCTLMSRGALISMVVVLLILPSMFLLLDKVIINTSLGFKCKKERENNVMNSKVVS